ncbi:hypothetical protein X275_01610 [Marinitoga sp. 1197]|uniref:hypothetical protein n=1 Tax=Marinitoga sp. 1197 TaxID=1428449 RepID=UPI000640ECA4|nr:hypothetical protein [Marinitoga sp. 1197]KLO23812.1 hypothetical protein X275_01610 [Marinitoga sp. 1197]
MDYTEYINYQESINKILLDKLIKNWQVIDGIKLKVNLEGKYIRFIGNTILIFIEQNDIKIIKEIQKILYSKVGEILALPLNADTFHITIHDLCNSFTYKNVVKCMKETEKNIKKIFIENFCVLKNEIISFKSIGLFHGGSAIGIQFIPANKKDYLLLMNIYNKIEKIFPLNKILIPHITLGYYKPVDYSIEELKKIKSAIETIKFNIKINLKIKNLSFEKFYTMNDYSTIFSLKSLC